MAFNIAFISVFVYHRLVVRQMMCNTPPPPHIPQKLRENFMKNMHPFQQNFHQKKEEFSRNLMRKNFDPEEASKKLNETLEKQMQMERELGENLIKMRTKMTHDEAVEFFKNRSFRKNFRRRRKR